MKEITVENEEVVVKEENVVTETVNEKGGLYLYPEPEPFFLYVT